MIVRASFFVTCSFFFMSLLAIPAPSALAQTVAPQVPAITYQGPEPDALDLSPEETTGLKEVQSLSHRITNVLNEVNPFATDSGLAHVISDLEKHGRNLENFAKQVDEFGNRISNNNIKRLAGVVGRDKMGQVKELQKKASELSDFFKKYRGLADVVTYLDPGSKALGALSAGDVSGALLKVVSGACKITITGLAATAGAVGGTAVLGPGGGTLVGGAIAGSAADKLYESYVTPVFESMNQTIVNLKATEQLNMDRLNSAYGGVAGAKFKDWLQQYLRGDMSGPEFMALMKPHWDEIRQRNAELAKKRAEDRDLVVAALRRIESKQPDIKKLTDEFENAKLDRSGQIKLLKVLQQEYGQSCKDKLSREYVRDQLKSLDHAKLLQVLSRTNSALPPDLMSCLCPAGHWYAPGPNGPCATLTHAYVTPVWAQFDSDLGVWEKCMAKYPIFVEKDQAGKIVFPGIRIDEYIAGKRVLKEIKNK